MAMHITLLITMRKTLLTHRLQFEFELRGHVNLLAGTSDESLGGFLTATSSVTAIRPTLALCVVHTLVATETCKSQAYL